MPGDEDVEPILLWLLDVASCPARTSALHALFGEFCHQFRNRLNSLKLSLFLAKRTLPPCASEDWTHLEARYRAIEELIDQFHGIFRPMPLTPLKFALDAVLADRRPVWESWFAATGRRLEFIPPPEAAKGAIDPTRLIQGLDALASWRSSAGEPATEDRVSWWGEGSELRLRWEGPEGTADEADASSLPLALPMLARVVAAHGGRMQVQLRGRVEVGLRWPREPPVTASATATGPSG